MNFLFDNLGTIIVGTVLLLIISTIILKMHNDKKSGKIACGCNCSNCPSVGLCHNQYKRLH